MDSDRATDDGRHLAAAFWDEVVRPALASAGTVSATRCGAALLGPGSEVLGFDDERSRDHDFGPRLQVVVPSAERPTIPVLEQALAAALPERFRGFAVRFATTNDPVPRHRVLITTVDDLFRVMCGIEHVTSSVTVDEWLLAPTQVLRSVAAGPLFADPTGALSAAQAVTAWYPDDVWRYVLACQWRRLAQHEHLAPRAGDAGDELGSRLLAATLATDLIKLAFLLERVWAPYPKWLGTAYAQLTVEARLRSPLAQMLAAASWRERQEAYVAAAGILADVMNQLGLVDPIDTSSRPFHTRPFEVIGADRFADALMATSSLHARGWLGAIDQWTDNTDVLTDRGH